MLFSKGFKRFFIFIFIFQIDIYLINSATTDFEMERVCSSGEFDKMEHKTGYRTLQHYADDDNIEVSKAHPFYRELFMEGKTTDKVTFIKSIILELIVIFVAVVAFINYFFLILVWLCHCGIFKRLSDKEKLERQGSCKHCRFFFMFLFFLISLALCVFGVMFMSSFKKSINLSDCGLLRFTNHGLYGTNNDYAGAYNLKESFMNISYSLNKIDTFRSGLFLYYNNINNDYNDFTTRMTECNNYAVNQLISTPDPDKDKTINKITVNYQSIYGPNTDESTMLGIVNKKVNNKIKPILDSLTSLKNDFDQLITNKNEYISELRKYSEYFDLMKTMYETINRNIGKNYNKFMESGIKVVSNFALSLYFIFGILILLLIIFMFVYVCSKKSSVFISKYVRIIIHILWNLLFISSILSLALSGYIIICRKYSYNLIPSFNHLISSDIIYSTSSEENLFLEYANNLQISKGIELFYICYNSSQSTNLATILGIRDTMLYYFNNIYKHYNELLKYAYNNDLNENIVNFITNKKSVLDTYIYNITKTTTYEVHRENDIVIFINELNKYTDYSNKDTYQINCVTNTYDIWVTNREDCPSSYDYSIDGSQEKNCLIMSEWTIDMITLRYKPTCKTKSGEKTSQKTTKYLERLKEFYDENKQLVINMNNGIDNLISLHDELINNINLEIRNDNNTFLNFTLPYSMFTNDTSIYELFDCGILKDDLIDFYDITRHKLSINSIVHFVILLLISLFNIISIYLLIKILYIFNRTSLEDYMNKSLPEELGNDNVKDNNKYNLGYDDKHLLSINTKNKVTNKGNIKNKKKTNDINNNKNNDIKNGTKAEIFAGLGKNKETESSPSSSGEKLRDTNENFDNRSSEIEESEESNNDKPKKKDKDSSHEESEIESGIRDNGSAMS